MRHFLLLVNKVSSSNNLKYLYRQVQNIIGGSLYNSFFMLLGENQKQNDQQGQLESDDIYLLSFKFLFFQLLDRSKVTIQSKNIQASTHLQINIVEKIEGFENTERVQALEEYLGLYANNILQPDNFVELFCDLVTNEYQSNMSSCKNINMMLQPAFINICEYLKNQLKETERRHVILLIENYMNSTN